MDGSLSGRRVSRSLMPTWSWKSQLSRDKTQMNRRRSGRFSTQQAQTARTSSQSHPKRRLSGSFTSRCGSSRATMSVISVAMDTA